MHKNVILITGSSGFIGSALLKCLSDNSYSLVAPVRKSCNSSSDNVIMPVIEDIASLSDDCSWIQGCNVVVHTAAQAHVNGVSLTELKRINTDATLNFARLSAKAGVKRFIFLSSIGVNGINNSIPFYMDDLPAPIENYAVSKFQAEVGLQKIAAETGMELVIIRPPLVYGSNAPGNFSKLVSLVRKNLPLPFGAIHNKRSFVGVDNLIDLIITCIDHPNATNQIFLVSDDDDVSTTELLNEISSAIGKKSRLFPVPIKLLNKLAKLAGKEAEIDRLCSNLQVNIEHTKEMLGWRPRTSFKDGIRKCFNEE